MFVRARIPRSEWVQQLRCACWVITAILQLLNTSFQTEVIGPEPVARAELEGGGGRSVIKLGWDGGDLRLSPCLI